MLRPGTGRGPFHHQPCGHRGALADDRCPCEFMREADFVIALVTVPSEAVGRKLAGLILLGRLAACVNLLPQIESHYWWQGKRERSKECQLLIKTRRSKLAALERC